MLFTYEGTWDFKHDSNKNDIMLDDGVHTDKGLLLDFDDTIKYTVCFEFYSESLFSLF